MTNDYNQRQLNKMKELIAAFKESAISLSSFVSNMEFLFHALEEVKHEWEESFLDEITTLESVNSGVSPNISKKEIENILANSATKLEELVDKELRIEN